MMYDNSIIYDQQNIWQQYSTKIKVEIYLACDSYAFYNPISKSDTTVTEFDSPANHLRSPSCCWLLFPCWSEAKSGLLNDLKVDGSTPALEHSFPGFCLHEIA